MACTTMIFSLDCVGSALIETPEGNDVDGSLICRIGATKIEIEDGGPTRISIAIASQFAL
jgi:hypothetical protein